MKSKADFDDSLVEFLDQQGQSLLRLSVSLAGDYYVGEEVFQKVITDTYSKLQRVSREAWFSYIRIAIVNQHRSNWRNRKNLLEVTERENELEIQSEISNRLSLEKAVSALEPKIREAVVLRYVMGYSITETADLLSTNEMQIKNFCRKGLAQLKVQLTENPEIRGKGNV
jgi:RNA polymerase sigma factor (sigma-70 family)